MDTLKKRLIPVLVCLLLSAGIFVVSYAFHKTKNEEHATKLGADPRVLLPIQGGTGTGTPPTYGKVLVGNSQGTYTLTATSALGISGGGSSFGKTWEIVSNFLSPTTSLPIAVGGSASSTFARGLEAGLSIGSPYFNATSTTATSSLNGGLYVNRGVQFDDLTSCDTIDTDSNGFLKCGTDASGGGGGLGWASSTVPDTNSIFSTASKNVGVGTTSPFAKLSVHANSGETNTTLFAVASSTASATSTVFSITRDGNLTSHATGLTYLDSTGGNTSHLELTGSYAELYGGDELYLSSSASNIDIRSNLSLNATADLDLISVNTINDSSTFQVYTGGSLIPSIYVPTSGKVGIGTSSPYAKLSVVGEVVAANFTGTTTATSTFGGAITVGAGQGTSTFGGGLSTTRLNVTSGTSTFANDINVAGTATSTFTKGIQALQLNLTGSATNTASNGFNITSGCYAINSTCLSAGSSGATFGQSWEIGGNSITGFLAPTTTQKVWLGQASSTVFSANQAQIGSTATTTITSAGFIGIGTSSPYAALSVVGSSGVVADHYTATSTTASSSLPNVIINNVEIGGDYIEDITGNQLAITGNSLGVTDGSGSNLDADFFDGVDSGSFLRSDTSDQFTSGTLTINAGTTFTVSSTNVSFADTSISLTGATADLTTTGNFSINSNDIFVVKSDGDIVFNGVSTTSASVAIDVSANMLLIGQPNAGDPQITFAIGNPSVDTWSIGADDTDSDALIFSAGSTLGTTNHFRMTTASTTFYDAVEFAGDTETFIPGSQFEIENTARVCTGVANTPGNGTILLTPTAVTNSCTLQYYAPVPQRQNGEQVVLRSATFYYAAASSTAYIDTNQLVEYNPTDGTVTTQDNDTTDITAGTSHAMSGFPLTLGDSESGSAILFRFTFTFTTAANAQNVMTFRGIKLVWDTL